MKYKIIILTLVILSVSIVGIQSNVTKTIKEHFIISLLILYNLNIIMIFSNNPKKSKQ